MWDVCVCVLGWLGGGDGVAKLTYSPHHASAGVTLCQIIMWLLGESQWAAWEGGGRGREGEGGQGSRIRSVER